MKIKLSAEPKAATGQVLKGKVTFQGELTDFFYITGSTSTILTTTQKTIAMINAFSVATGEFLNHFCAKAHKKISQVNRQIERLEGLTALLEHKVNSFPADLNPPPAAPVATPQANTADPNSAPAAAVEAENALIIAIVFLVSIDDSPIRFIIWLLLIMELSRV